MSGAPGKVFIVDDDESVRRSLTRLLRSVRIEVETFASADEFLTHRTDDGPACLVLDVRMPGLSGPDLQRHLAHEGNPIPIVFITGYADISTGVTAMKDGAVDFLPKPFEDRELIGAIERAIDRDRRSRRERAAVGRIQRRLAALTPREHQVFALVATGMLNKQVADRLGTSEKTIKVHRARVMEKMNADSLVPLIFDFFKKSLVIWGHRGLERCAVRTASPSRGSRRLFSST